MDRHRRPVLRKESEPFVGKSCPAGANDPAKGGAAPKKSNLKNWGVASNI
jgi:hypothetical protein